MNIRHAERELRIDKADKDKAGRCQARSRWEFCKRYGPKEGPEKWNASEKKELRVDESDRQSFRFFPILPRLTMVVQKLLRKGYKALTQMPAQKFVRKQLQEVLSTATRPPLRVHLMWNCKNSLKRPI